MGHDVIEDRYARLYEQPFQLAELGHDVLGVCLSYRNCTTKDELHPTTKGSMRWIGLSAGKLRLNLITYPFALINIAKEFKPDIIVGASDCLHVALGYEVARMLKIKFAADLYDDFETFGLAKLPLIKHFYRKALKHSSVVSCVSESLTSHITSIVSDKTKVIFSPSTIDRSIFAPKSKSDCRKKFNIPDSSVVIGTAGSLTKEKGIETVYLAFQQVLDKAPETICILAGQIDEACPPPKHKNIIYIGKLPHSQVAELFCAFDVGVVYLRNTKYGQYSFPQKAYEMSACKIPVVVASVGDMRVLFSSEHNELYEPDDSKSLANAILEQISRPYHSNLSIDDWSVQAEKLAIAYEEILNA